MNNIWKQHQKEKKPIYLAVLVACFKHYLFYAFHGRFVRSITDWKQNPIIDQKCQVYLYILEKQILTPYILLTVFEGSQLKSHLIVNGLKF